MRGTFVLVGCGAQKADEPRPARDLYTSTYFRLKRRYAEAATAWAGKHQASAWAILSASRGVIPSRIETEPYDTTIADLDGDELDTWARRVRSALTSWLNWPFSSDNDPRDSPCGRLVVLAGEQYIQPLEGRDAFSGKVKPGQKGGPGLPTPPEFPFREHDLGGIGEQMGWLKERAAEIEAKAAPANQDELSSFNTGIKRERALWQLDRPSINIKATEQASLTEFEDVPQQYIATEQQRLTPAVPDGGRESTTGQRQEPEADAEAGGGG
jgi:hypothetical protein